MTLIVSPDFLAEYMQATCFSRIVSTSSAEHQLEWFWLPLMPGVAWRAVKIIAILPCTLAVADVRYGAYDQSKGKRKVAIPQLDFSRQLLRL